MATVEELKKELCYKPKHAAAVISDEDIKKALECCGDETGLHWCTDCPYYNKENDLCQEDLNRDSLALINRQQERIEELEIITGLANNRKNYRKFVDEVFCKQKGKELSEPDFDYIYQLYFEQQAENEKFQSLCTSKDVIIKDQQAEIEHLKRNLSQCENGYSQELHLARCKLEELKNFCTLKDAVVKELRAVNERLKAKIDDLKHEIRNLECEKGQLEGTIDFLVEQAKSEAIKEFAERLRLRVIKTRFDAMYGAVIEISNDTITELVKEMVGGENA